MDYLKRMGLCSFLKHRLGMKNTHHQKSTLPQQAQLWNYFSESSVASRGGAKIFPYPLPLCYQKLTNLATKLISFSSKAFYAGASHCSQRQAVINFALCILNARPKFTARVSTSPLPPMVIQACLLGHSLSILHPSSTTGSGTEIDNWIYAL